MLTQKLLPDPPNPARPQQPPVFVIVSICFGAGTIAIMFFQWLLVQLLTPFLIGPLLLCLLAVLGLFIIASFIYLVLNLRDPARGIQPLLINVVTALIVFYVPFTEIWLAIEFRMNLQGYNEVVELVEQDHLQPNEYGWAELPQEYRYLSRGGDIVIDTSDGTLSVFFYTFRGILDNYSGYMYRADDTPPTGDWTQVERVRPHWYFCASS